MNEIQTLADQMGIQNQNEIKYVNLLVQIITKNDNIILAEDIYNELEFAWNYTE